MEWHSSPSITHRGSKRRPEEPDDRVPDSQEAGWLRFGSFVHRQLECFILSALLRPNLRTRQLPVHSAWLGTCAWSGWLVHLAFEYNSSPHET